MPYPNEHAARMMDPGVCEDKSFRRKKAGKGISLILCKRDGAMQAQAYRFDKTMYTPDEAKAWIDKAGLKEKMISFEPAVETKVNAKLSMKAANGMPEVDGRIWSAGMHHVFVNDKPARIYVPEETIGQTFDSIRGLIKDTGRMPIGIDHLSDTVLGENEILAKMNLLDVGDVTKVGTDGTSIYILDSELKNQQIKDLNATGSLPAYSIVGAMDAQPCPTGKADYVVKSIDVERVDFVEEGGCSVCKVGAQPDELILTSKKSMEEFDMVKASEATPIEPVEEPNETVEEEVVEEKLENNNKGQSAFEEPAPVVEEPKVEEPKVEPKVEEPKVEEPAVEEPVVEEPSEIDELKKEIKELKEMLGGKKPKVEASSSINVDEEITKLIKAGKATPAMRDALKQVAEQSTEAFLTMAASMPKFVNMKMESKLAKIEEEVKKPKKTAQEEWDEKYGEYAKAFRV